MGAPTCFLCGSARTASQPYLRLNSTDRKRNLAYAIPRPICQALGALSPRFRAAYLPVATNKRYFDRQAVYCPDCSTGSCVPFFTKERLDEYYRTFYWSNRAHVDGRHIPQGDRPNELQLVGIRDRMEWLAPHRIEFQSVLDFGAGDCAAAYTFSRHGKAAHVVDPSADAEQLAHRYGLGYSKEAQDAPMVDLVYSAHAVEHVHDLVPCFEALMSRVKPGGYAFIETPNVPDPQVFFGVVLTPHTFALSAETFRRLADRVGMQIVATEVCGPPWTRSMPKIRSDARTDIRVLLHRA